MSRDETKLAGLRRKPESRARRDGNGKMKPVQSGNRGRLKKQVIGRYRPMRNRRGDRVNKACRELADKYDHVSAELLKGKNMTASAGGPAESPGRNVARKTGLNRSMLRQGGWYMIVLVLSFMPGRKGGAPVRVNPANASRECSDAGTRRMATAGRSRSSSGDIPEQTPRAASARHPMSPGGPEADGFPGKNHFRETGGDSWPRGSAGIRPLSKAQTGFRRKQARGQGTGAP